MSVVEEAGFPIGGPDDPKYMVLQVGARWQLARQQLAPAGRVHA
jgi:hypothetical protein